MDAEHSALVARAVTEVDHDGAEDSGASGVLCPNARPFGIAFPACSRRGSRGRSTQRQGSTLSRRVRMLIAGALGDARRSGRMAGPATAGIWTEIPSGTSATITAIEYQSDARMWFTTSNGEIWKRRPDLSGFDRVYGPSVDPFNDIEFQAGRRHRPRGRRRRARSCARRTAAATLDRRAARIPASNHRRDGSGNKCTINTPFGNVHFVRFAGNGRCGSAATTASSRRRSPRTRRTSARGHVGGREPQAAPVPMDNCWISTQNEGFADMFVTANPDVFYIATGYFGEVVYSTTNLTSHSTDEAAGRRQRVHARAARWPAIPVTRTGCGACRARRTATRPRSTPRTPTRTTTGSTS